jgi:phosphopantetheinyl transferase
MEWNREAFLKMEGVGLSTTLTRVEARKEYESEKE